MSFFEDFVQIGVPTAVGFFTGGPAGAAAGAYGGYTQAKAKNEAKGKKKSSPAPRNYLGGGSYGESDYGYGGEEALDDEESEIARIIRAWAEGEDERDLMKLSGSPGGPAPEMPPMPFDLQTGQYPQQAQNGVTGVIGRAADSPAPQMLQPDQAQRRRLFGGF